MGLGFGVWGLGFEAYRVYRNCIGFGSGVWSESLERVLLFALGRRRQVVQWSFSNEDSMKMFMQLVDVLQDPTPLSSATYLNSHS